MRPSFLGRALALALGLGALLLVAQPATAQGQHASAKLYARADGSVVRAAIAFEVEKTWKLYHTDLGDPNALAVPTTFEWSGAPVTWSEVDMGTPEVEFVDGIPGLDPYSVNYHKGKFTAYAIGTLAPGGALDGLEVRIEGQTCDPGSCTQYAETVRLSGAGPDALFTAFPSGLTAPASQAVPSGAASRGFDLFPDLPGAAPAPGGDPQGDGFDWEAEFDAFTHLDARLVLTTDGTRVRARIEVVVEDDWHLFHGPAESDIGDPGVVGAPTTFEFEGEGVEWGAMRFPEPETGTQLGEDGQPLLVNEHHGQVVFEADGQLEEWVTAADLEELTLLVSGQTCNADGCVPVDLEVKVARVDEVDALEAGASEGGADPQGGSVLLGMRDTEADEATPAGGSTEGPLPLKKEKPLWGFLLEAVIWGLITLLMPCTYPMIPITISFFTKQADQRGGNVLPLSLAYGFGIISIFVFIGVVVGQPIQEFAVNPWFNLLIAGMFFFFALVLFGWINLQPPAFLMNAAGKASMKGGLLGVFLMGLTLVVTSFTCTAPFVGTLLARGAGQGLTRTVLGMGVFGATMALPFVLLSLFPSRVRQIPSAGAWMNTLKVFLGFVEIAAALKFVSVADVYWSWNLLSKELFLLLWGGIFLIAAIFMFGRINLKGEQDGQISPGRMVTGLTTFLFALYCFYLTQGFKMDPLMTAFAPPYSHAPVRAAMGGAERKPTVIKDDYDLAAKTAIAEGKALLVNFTGHN